MISLAWRERLLCAVAFTSVLAEASGPAHAEPAPAFSVLLRQALLSSPRLVQNEAEVERASGLALQARARPNPNASVYIENVVGSDSYAALGGQTTFQVEQALELGGKRSARISAGQATLEAVRATRLQARLNFAVDLAASYARAEASERRIELGQQALDLALEDLRVARVLVDSGKEAELRSVQVEAEVAATRARLSGAKADSAGAFAALTALAAAARPISSIVDGLLKSADTPASVPAFDLEASLAYRAALAEREAASRRVRLERAQAVPNLTVSAGVRDLAGRDVAGVVGLSMPIPVFDQNRGNISAAQADLRAADAKLRSVRLDLEADARSASARALAADDQLSAAKIGEAAAEEAYRLTRRGYAGGKLPLLEVLSARRALTDARSQTLEARIARLAAASQLSRLAGRTPFGDQP